MEVNGDRIGNHTEEHVSLLVNLSRTFAEGTSSHAWCRRVESGLWVCVAPDGSFNGAWGSEGGGVILEPALVLKVVGCTERVEIISCYECVRKIGVSSERRAEKMCFIDGFRARDCQSRSHNRGK